MFFIINFFKVLVLSVVEGITEFLPISSTGHLIIVNKFLYFSPEKFQNAFNVIIQLGAILAVVALFFTKLNPFATKKIGRPKHFKNMDLKNKLNFFIKNADKRTVSLWIKVIVAVLPAVVLGLLFDDFIDEKLFNFYTVAITLFVYGVIIIMMENINSTKRKFTFESVHDIDLKTAFLIGLFQCLALIPGTSRSAATIIGAMILGTSRVAAAEFSFFLAIPTMLGATMLKVLKNLSGFSLDEWFLIILGTILSFVVAFLVIGKFMKYIQKHDFRVFGIYRIGLSIVMLFVIIIGFFIK